MAVIEQVHDTEALDLTNKSVVKATQLLSELGRHPQGISVTALALIVGITRPTAFRLLLSMEQAGFVDRGDDGRYRLGWQVARLGRLADPYAGLVARIQPVLDAYAESLGETINFSMLRGETDYDVIAEASAGRFLNVASLYIGRSYPLHVSATGKVALAELDDERIAEVLPETLERFTAHSITSRSALLAEVRRVRDQGYAILDDELEDGLFAVACPARAADGELFGIVVLQGPTQRMKSSGLHHVIGQVRQAAAEIALALAANNAVSALP